MFIQTKTNFFLYMLTLFMCLNSFFLMDTAAQVNTESDEALADDNYTFETIDVPGVDFLAVTASSDFDDYAGYTKSADGEKDVAFTLIDDVFTTYDFPGSQNTYFYALGNDGRAAGHYEDSNGLHHGVILEDGELRQYDFPGAIETFIYVISDATGLLTGDFIDDKGVRRGFSGDIIVEFPGAVETYAGFVGANGVIMGSYIDAEGVYHAYIRTPDGTMRSIDVPQPVPFEYLYGHGINNAGTYVARAKVLGDIPRTFVGSAVERAGVVELKFPGSVITDGWNINQDGSIVGHYESVDGRTHGFIARPVEDTTTQVDPDPDATADENYTFETIDVPGVDFLALTASSDFNDYAGYTKSSDGEKEIAFTLIDGVFTTYDFPGSQKTHFYALGNNGNAAGHYQDNEGLYHGVVLENGELRQYDFPDAVQTEIYGISDATGALTGNFTDADGVRRGFTGDIIVEFPGSTETYADFINASGGMVGSYVDAEGVYHPYVRTPNGDFISLDLPNAEELEYFFVHGINDIGNTVARSKQVDGPPTTLIGIFGQRLQEFKVPGSVSTEGWNINQDSSIVGHYDSPDGQRHGFIARPIGEVEEIIDESVFSPADFHYTFETIDVPGIEYLRLTASSDFEDYAGYTKSTDDKKMVAFTLIDGVFTTYDFPSSKNTYFYALGNNGVAAGHYEDTDGLYHGVILENGELRQYDFPGAVQTEIYGYSDVTGVFTGNFTDTDGVRRGFSGDIIVEGPGATATYADFVNARGVIVGSYVDADGLYHLYGQTPDGRFADLDILDVSNLEYFFLHGINDARGAFMVTRAKAVGDVPRTYIGSLPQGLHELNVPGSVITEGWSINQDGSIVGHYESADGRIHGFIARPVEDTPTTVDPEPDPTADENYTFETIDVPGVDFLALTASSDFDDYAGYTRSADGEKDVAFTLIDGVFMTYEFPGAQGTYFFALGNNGVAAGHYEDSDGIYHGVILEDGELRQYDFPGAVQTEIYGYSDSTGVFTGNFTDAEGVRRGFSGDKIIEVPGAVETYAEFVAANGVVIGSYVDADGVYQGYVLAPDGTFIPYPFPTAENLEYIFLHGGNEHIAIATMKPVGDVPITVARSPEIGIFELKVPGSVSTEGWSVNQDGSVVGFYDSADGRRHGFIARPIADTTVPIVELHYTFETIDVPGVDFLALAASSDFEDYAGYTKSADGEKDVAFTLIDGVFMTYEFPGAQHTYFFALGNNGQAAGHYEDSEGLFHGVILEDGEMRQYDFPGAVQTFIYGYSDANGVLTGNFIGVDGVRRGFSGDEIIEIPGAAETYTEFVNSSGRAVGSYVDADGIYYPYERTSDGTFLPIFFTGVEGTENLEYLFLPGVNDERVIVARAKEVGSAPVTLVIDAQYQVSELKFPGSVSTEGWNINQDGSIVGHYESADGRTHGFIARLVTETESDFFGNVFNVTLTKGLNMLSLPLAPPKPMTAKSLAGITGATVVIALDAENQRFIGWTPGAPNDGFPIEGGQGYIVNVPQARNFAFVGSHWTNETEDAAAPSATSLALPEAAWAFVVSGHLEGKPAFDGYKVIVRNLRTNSTITASVQDSYFAAATADLARRSVVKVGDVIELRVIGPDGNIESQTRTFKVTPERLANALLSVKFDSIGKPNQNQLLQNYPNPFNPETWIPYQLSEDSPISVSIYDTTGKLVRTLSLGFQSTGFYNSRSRAVYWDGKNALGETVASGLYFYTLTAGEFSATRKMLIMK